MKKIYYLFGGGNNCYGAIRFFGKENIIAIIDNNIEKVGTEIEGIPVKGFQDLLNAYNTETVIITAFVHSDQIREQLEECGIDNYYVCPFMSNGFYTCEEIIRKLEIETYNNIAIYKKNLLSELLVDKLQEMEINTRIKYLSKLQELDKNDALLLAVDKEDSARNELKKENSNEILDIFALEDIDSNFQHPELKQYYNKYSGGRCFLVGSGPSLTMKDLNTLYQNNEISFGCNKLFLTYENTNWRPQYYVVGDYNAFLENYQKLKLLEDSEFFFREFSNLLNSPKSIDCMHTYHACGERYYPGYPTFSGDIAQRVYGGRTVMYDMLQIAAYMGFSEIYLLGVDFSFLGGNMEKGSKSIPTHFCDNYLGKQISVGGVEYRDEILHAYMAAEKHSREHGFRIYNATRGGELEVFERVDFDSLF